MPNRGARSGRRPRRAAQGREAAGGLGTGTRSGQWWRPRVCARCASPSPKRRTESNFTAGAPRSLAEPCPRPLHLAWLLPADCPRSAERGRGPDPCYALATPAASRPSAPRPRAGSGGAQRQGAGALTLLAARRRLEGTSGAVAQPRTLSARSTEPPRQGSTHSHHSHRLGIEKTARVDPDGAARGCSRLPSLPLSAATVR